MHVPHIKMTKNKLNQVTFLLISWQSMIIKILLILVQLYPLIKMLIVIVILVAIQLWIWLRWIILVLRKGKIFRRGIKNHRKIKKVIWIGREESFFWKIGFKNLKGRSIRWGGISIIVLIVSQDLWIILEIKSVRKYIQKSQNKGLLDLFRAESALRGLLSLKRLIFMCRWCRLIRWKRKCGSFWGLCWLPWVARSWILMGR